MFLNDTACYKLYFKTHNLTMFAAICDYAKVVICKNLPTDVSYQILNIAKHELQKPLKEQMKYVLSELQNNERAVYYNLLSEIYQKYIGDWQALHNIHANDFIIDYYIRNLAFGVRMCGETADMDDAFEMFETFLMYSKAKSGYILAMRYVLNQR